MQRSPQQQQLEDDSKSSAGGVQVAWLLERKDRLLRQLVEARPQQYVETVGRLQTYANRALVVPGLFRIIPLQLECITNLCGHDRTVTSLVVANGDLVSAATDGLILIWDLDLGKPRIALKDPSVTSGCRCMTVMADGWLLAYYDHGPINMWDVTSGRVMNRIVTDHTDVIEAMVISDISRGCHIVALMKLKTRDISTIEAPEDPVAAAAHSAELLRAAAEDARRQLLLKSDSRVPVLVTASADATVRVWDLETLDCITVLRGHEGRVSSVLMINGEIYSASDDKTIMCWDGNQSGFPITRKWVGHEGGISALVQMKSDLILSGSQDCTIGIWSISENKRLTVLEGHMKAVVALAKIDDDYLVSSGVDQCIKIWSVTELYCIQTFPCNALTMLSVNNLIFTGGSSSFIKMWTSASLTLNQVKYEKPKEVIKQDMEELHDEHPNGGQNEAKGAIAED